MPRFSRNKSLPLITRFDDWVHARREKRALNRNMRATIIPAIGYGSQGWVRVLGRVLYLKDSTPPHLQLSSPDVVLSRVRGWRSFTSVHVPYEEITVSVDGETLGTVTADRGGVIDTRVKADLTPGWQTCLLYTSPSPRDRG